VLVTVVQGGPLRADDLLQSSPSQPHSAPRVDRAAARKPHTKVGLPA
jgi:hypothetical protein